MMQNLYYTRVAYDTIRMNGMRRKTFPKAGKCSIPAYNHKLLLTFIILCICIFTAVLTVQANSTGNAQHETYYTSVEIQPGDSLWSISQNYTDGSVREINKCINEICEINDISRLTTIKAGRCIIVPYEVEVK